MGYDSACIEKTLRPEVRDLSGMQWKLLHAKTSRVRGIVLKKRLETILEQLCDCSNRSIVHLRKGLMLSNLHHFVDKSLLNLKTKTYFFYHAVKSVETNWKKSRWKKKNRVVESSDCKGSF